MPAVPGDAARAAAEPCLPATARVLNELCTARVTPSHNPILANNVTVRQGLRRAFRLVMWVEKRRGEAGPMPGGEPGCRGEGGCPRGPCHAQPAGLDCWPGALSASKIPPQLSLSGNCSRVGGGAFCRPSPLVRLQWRWLSRQLLRSVGLPPLLRGTISSTSERIGCGTQPGHPSPLHRLPCRPQAIVSVLSTMSPHRWQRSSSASTWAMTCRRRWPFALAAGDAIEAIALS